MSVAFDRGELLPIAAAVRTFLEPMWLAWPRPAGGPPSRNTCGRSSTFLARVLEIDFAMPSRAAFGTPSLPPRPDCDAGFRTSGGWTAHAWVVAGPRLIDITADQFGAEQVIVACCDDPRYREAQDTASAFARAQRHNLAEALWPLWLGSEPRRRLEQSLPHGAPEPISTAAATAPR